MQEEEDKMSRGFMMQFFEKQEAGTSSAVTASDMNVDQSTSISEVDFSVFQEP